MDLKEGCDFARTDEVPGYVGFGPFSGATVGLAFDDLCRLHIWLGKYIAWRKTQG